MECNHTKYSSETIEEIIIHQRGIDEPKEIMVGKFKPKILFKMRGPYECGPKERCLIFSESGPFMCSIPEAKSLWMQIGMALGINEKRVRQCLSMVPYDKRPIE